MPSADENLRLAIKRFLALDKTWGVVEHFKRDVAMSDRHADAVVAARDRLKDAFEEWERE